MVVYPPSPEQLQLIILFISKSEIFFFQFVSTSTSNTTVFKTVKQPGRNQGLYEILSVNPSYL